MIDNRGRQRCHLNGLVGAHRLRERVEIGGRGERVFIPPSTKGCGQRLCGGARARALDFAFGACPHTRTIIGTPAISASAFAGRREDPYRAGTTAITETSARDFLRYSRLTIEGAHSLVTDRASPCQFRAAKLPTIARRTCIKNYEPHQE